MTPVARPVLSRLRPSPRRFTGSERTCFGGGNVWDESSDSCPRQFTLHRLGLEVIDTRHPEGAVNFSCSLPVTAMWRTRLPHGSFRMRRYVS